MAATLKDDEIWFPVHNGQILGQDMHDFVTDSISVFQNLPVVCEAFSFLDEILGESKKSFATPDIELLPQTPTIKKGRKRQRVIDRTCTGESELDSSKSRSKATRTAKGTASDDTANEQSCLESINDYSEITYMDDTANDEIDNDCDKIESVVICTKSPAKKSVRQSLFTSSNKDISVVTTPASTKINSNVPESDCSKSVPGLTVKEKVSTYNKYIKNSLSPYKSLNTNLSVYSSNTNEVEPMIDNVHNDESKSDGTKSRRSSAKLSGVLKSHSRSSRSRQRSLKLSLQRIEHMNKLESEATNASQISMSNSNTGKIIDDDGIADDEDEDDEDDDDDENVPIPNIMPPSSHNNGNMRTTRSKTRHPSSKSDTPEFDPKSMSTPQNVPRLQSGITPQISEKRMPYNNGEQRKRSTSVDAHSGLSRMMSAKKLNISTTKNKVLPIKSYFASCSNVSFNNSRISFNNNRTTPLKTCTKETQDRRKDLEIKELEAAMRVQRHTEIKNARAENLRKQNEERHKKVQQRKMELEQQEKQQIKGIQKKQDKKYLQANKAQEERLREEKDRQKIRDKKMQEVEDRRKQDEEITMEKLKVQQEQDWIASQALKARKDEEEKDKQLRRVEDYQLTEEKRKQAETEAQVQRTHIIEAELQKRHEEVERNRLIEEREKKEKREKELNDLKLKKHKEEQKLAELKLQREMEAQKMKAKQEEEKRLQEEARKKAAIHKQNEALPSSSNSQPALNTTVTKENVPPVSSSNCDSYDMTPTRTKPKPMMNPTDDNYGINNIGSDDSTDEEDAPKKKIPAWAQGPPLKVALIGQYYNPPDLDIVFDDAMSILDLNLIFKQTRPRFNKRTSSSIWDCPMMKPSGKPLYHN